MALSPFAPRGRKGGRKPGREESVHLKHTNSHLLLLAFFFLPLICSEDEQEKREVGGTSTPGLFFFFAPALPSRTRPQWREVER